MCHRRIFYCGSYYINFFNKLEPEIQKKFNWTLQLIETTRVIPEKYFKHITGTNSLYEIRVDQGTNAFRVFAFFDVNNRIILEMVFRRKLKRHLLLKSEKLSKLKKNISKSSFK
jgi:phage-related protein